MALTRQILAVGVLCAAVAACHESSPAPAAQGFEDRVHAWVGKKLEVRHLDTEGAFWEDFQLVLRLIPAGQAADRLAFDRVPADDNKIFQHWYLCLGDDQSLPPEERLGEDLRMKQVPTIALLLGNGYNAHAYEFQLVDGELQGTWSGRSCLGPTGQGRAVLQLAASD